VKRAKHHVALPKTPKPQVIEIFFIYYLITINLIIKI
jgi:hypothetical protein